MKSLNKKIIFCFFITVAFLSGCNEPSDPDVNAMAVGSWRLMDLLVDNQVVANSSSYFTLNLQFKDNKCVFINHDGVGMTGTWSIESNGSSLQILPDSEGEEAITFNILYLVKDEMGLQQTVTSTLLGDMEYTYFLYK